MDGTAIGCFESEAFSRESHHPNHRLSFGQNTVRYSESTTEASRSLTLSIEYACDQGLAIDTAQGMRSEKHVDEARDGDFLRRRLEIGDDVFFLKEVDQSQPISADFTCSGQCESSEHRPDDFVDRHDAQYDGCKKSG